jgi:predicted TIM-barrel fold metal-dependent hydrolase
MRHVACQELDRCVRDHGAVGAFVRPNYVNGRYWHSTYWDPLYSQLQDLGIPLCFHARLTSWIGSIAAIFSWSGLC